MWPHSTASHSLEIHTYLTSLLTSSVTYPSLFRVCWMCVYTGPILTSSLQTHTGPSRFPVVEATCQRPFSSVSLVVVCVICECATQGGWGGLCCDVVSPCGAWRGSAVETETEFNSHIYSLSSRYTNLNSPALYLFLSFPLSLSDAHWSDISGWQMPAIKCIKELLKNNWMCLQCFANLTLGFWRLILPGWRSSLPPCAESADCNVFRDEQTVCHKLHQWFIEKAVGGSVFTVLRSRCKCVCVRAKTSDMCIKLWANGSDPNPDVLLCCLLSS